MKRIVIHIDRIALRGAAGVAKPDIVRAIAARLSGYTVQRAATALQAKRPRNPVAERIGAAVVRAVQRSTGR